jgi:hypothetical protein
MAQIYPGGLTSPNSSLPNRRDARPGAHP